MHSKILEVVLVCLLLAGTAAADIEVYDGGSIQAALDNASMYERINVSAGTYIENLHITTPVRMQGTGVILRAADANKPGVHIAANCTKVSGFDISGASKGIYAMGITDANITGNVVHHNVVNIEVNDVSHTWIAGNAVYEAEDEGIYVLHSERMSVFGNTVYNNAGMAGILAFGCDNITFHTNLIHSNICMYGGITLYWSHYNKVNENQLHNNSVGIYIKESNNNLMWDNIFADGGYSSSTSLNTWCLHEIGHGKNVVGGALQGGNYWSAYTGIDEGGDGFGDAPHDIPGCSDQDMHPLMSPKCGDCDGNGYTSANDVILAYRRAVDPSYEIPHAWVADADGNDYISANDVVEIYRRAVDPTHELHCVLNIE